jgi:hypothetical protein
MGCPTSASDAWKEEVFKVGSLGVKLEDWPMARARLNWCCRLARRFERGGSRQGPLQPSYGVCSTDGLSRTGSSEEEKTQRNEKLKESLQYFDKASKLDPWNYAAFFWMAYVEDELGMLDDAIRHNGEVLRISCRLAAAKLNIAISRIKKGEMQQALDQLKLISPLDEDGMGTLNSAWEDDELRPLLDDPHLGAAAKMFLAPYR